MTLTVTLLGTGSPLPNPECAGPATLISTGRDATDEHYLVDAGRGVLMRLAALGLGAANLTAVLLTHLHSDHITDLNDVITTRWVMTLVPTPLTIVGPLGTRAVVDHLLAALSPDIAYRIAHHADLDGPPSVEVIEVGSGSIALPGSVTVRCAPTDHKPVEPSVGYRFDHGPTAVVVAGDTVPCDGLDELCAGAAALVHTTIRKDIIANLPIKRLRDTLDYHSSPEQAAQTAARAGVGTLVLTHYVPPLARGDEDGWRQLAAGHFGGRIEVGPDLHRIDVGSTASSAPTSASSRSNQPMDTLRTPDDRFANLPGFPFAPHYAEIPDGVGGDLRVHYLDEGPAGADPVLLLHGEPSWSFLYRHMVPPLVAAGHRVVVPDLVGFGRSDKPIRQDDYTYARHIAWMSALVFDALDLRDITFFGQDWGGLIGLRLVAAQPDRFARVAVGNTGLPTGNGTPSDAFLAWQKFSQESPNFPIGGIVNGGCATDLTPEVVAAYDAPFPDDTFTAGARIFPTLVPTRPDDPEAPANQEAWAVLAQFDKPFLTCFSDRDPITKGGDAPFRAKVPGAQGQPHTSIVGAAHFLQEDEGPQLANVLVDFIAATAG